MDNEQKKTNRPNNVARIPCSLSDSFFRYWFMFWEPFHKLTKREKEIIIRRYGLFNNKEMTQKEIAKEMMISRSYVSRIEKRAISKILKEFIKSNKTL